MDAIAAVALRIDARLVVRISAAFLAAELVIALTTFLPNAPVVPTALVFLLFPGVFIVHLRSVAVLRSNRDRSKRRGRPRLGELLAPFPARARLAFFVLFGVGWLVAITSISHVRGQPTQIHGVYYLNDHGTAITVTHREYLHAVVLTQRIFTMIPAVFYALAVIVNWPWQPRPAAPDAGAWPAAPSA